MGKPPWHRDRGFTLVEILVVLILTGLGTTLLLQGLQQALRLQGDVGTEIFSSHLDNMHVAWFRHSVNGMVPDHRGNNHVFRGGRDRMDGLTLSPLVGQEGAQLPVSWRLRFDPEQDKMQLIYGTGTSSPVILAWPGGAGRFEFVDASGVGHEVWPPFSGSWPQLPAAVRLHVGSEGHARVIAAAPRGPTSVLPRARDFQDR